MRAAVYREFGGPLAIETVDDPTPAADDVIIELSASGVCRSDIRGWLGHDPDVVLPHIPGHELAGTIVAVGRDVTGFDIGARVTTPFCGACGRCPTCEVGHTQICDNATQPGFTAWGSFAEYVAIEHAAVNVVVLPDEVDMVSAALVGCRFITAYRAVVERAELRTGEWLAVHGCGGVGMSAVMIGVASGASVVAIDVDSAALARASALGAEATIDASGKSPGEVVEAVRSATGGGAHVSLDALGSPITASNSIGGLRKLGRHVQPGLFHDDLVALPMNDVIGRELTVLGTHGMAGHRIPDLLAMIVAGILRPIELLGQEITLDDVPTAFAEMRAFTSSGVSVVTAFG